LKGCPDTDGDGVADKDDKCPDTPKGWKVDATGCPLDQDKDGVPDAEHDCPTVAGPKENKGCPVKVMSDAEIKMQQMIAEPVYFDFDKANVKASEKSKIDSLVNAMKENIDYKINITGHADNVGPAQYNMGLSERRINSVVKAITAKGINKDRILSQKAMGETSPVAPNDTREGRKQNRRVEFEAVKSE
jgi:outer membrane protein OmpA-like peptidoglycan-associated protein